MALTFNEVFSLETLTFNFIINLHPLALRDLVQVSKFWSQFLNNIKNIGMLHHFYDKYYDGLKAVNTFKNLMLEIRAEEVKIIDGLTVKSDYGTVLLKAVYNDNYFKFELMFNQIKTYICELKTINISSLTDACVIGWGDRIFRKFIDIFEGKDAYSSEYLINKLIEREDSERLDIAIKYISRRNNFYPHITDICIENIVKKSISVKSLLEVMIKNKPIFFEDDEWREKLLIYAAARGLQIYIDVITLFKEYNYE